MRHVRVLVAAAAVLTACAAVHAAPKTEPPDGEFHPERLHRPQDCAPPEQIIVPRPPLEARPKGSLISTAQHQPRRVDTHELLRRKYDLYAGRQVTHSLPGAGGPVSPAAVETPAGLTPPQGLTLADVAFWSFVAVCALTALWLLAKVVRRRRRPEPA